MKNKVLTLICAAIFLIGVIGSIWMLKSPHGTQVNIVQDGKIRMLEAECPDKTCVHMGWLESGTLPIVCLPNHLSIEFADTANDVDAVVK